MTMTDAELEAYLDGLVGTELADPVTADDPVNVPTIRHLTMALGDRNPVYTDPDAAIRAGFDGVVAPAASLPIWTMTAPPGGAADEAVQTGRQRMHGVLDSCGYRGIVVGSMEQIYHRPLRVGDLLTCTLRLTAVSARKQTALGPGYFLTEVLGYVDASGASVGEVRRSILKYRPAEPAAAT